MVRFLLVSALVEFYVHDPFIVPYVLLTHSGRRHNLVQPSLAHLELCMRVIRIHWFVHLFGYEIPEALWLVGNVGRFVNKYAGGGLHLLQ